MKVVFKPLVNNLQTIAKRTFFSAAVNIREKTLKHFSEKDKNLQSFLRQYKDLTKDFSFKNPSSLLSYSEVTIEEASKLDQEVLKLTDPIKEYLWLFDNAYTRVCSINPFTRETLITQEEKINQMKNHMNYHDSYVRALKAWAQNKDKLRNNLENLSIEKSEIVATVFALDTLFYGTEKAKKENNSFVPENAESCYLVNTSESDPLPMESLSVFIPEKKKTFIKTFIDNENSCMPLYKNQMMGLSLMYKMGLINENDSNLLIDFTSHMRECIAIENKIQLKESNKKDF